MIRTRRRYLGEPCALDSCIRFHLKPAGISSKHTLQCPEYGFKIVRLRCSLCQRISPLLHFPIPSSIMFEMNATCPGCAAKFPCDPTENCWCAQIPWTEMPPKPTACLCPDCLSGRVEKMVMEEGENSLQRKWRLDLPGLSNHV
jgi:hypothetical protein